MSRLSRLRSEAGYTLAELLIATSLTLGVLGATLTVFEGSDRTSRRAQQQSEQQDGARQAVDRIARELRNQATPTASLPVAVLKATATDIAFVAVGTKRPPGSQNTRNLHRVRYCLNPETRILWWQERTWTTALPPADIPDTSSCPSTSGWTTTSPLVDRVSNVSGQMNRPVWVFGPAGATADQIRTVQTTIFVDADPTSAPLETELSTTIFLRNQNRAPVASMQARAIGDGHVLLVGSQSSDPEGQTLNYQWKDNGAVITTCTTPVCDYKPPGRGTRSFSLEVSDPSDLSASGGSVSVEIP